MTVAMANVESFRCVRWWDGRQVSTEDVATEAAQSRGGRDCVGDLSAQRARDVWGGNDCAGEWQRMT